MTCSRAGGVTTCETPSHHAGCAVEAKRGDALGRLRNNPPDGEDPPEQTAATTFTPHAFKTTPESPSRVRPLETDIPEKSRNHAENPEPTRRSAPVQCAAPRPAREGPHRPGAILRQAPTGNPVCAPGRVKAAAGGPTGNPAPPELRRRPPRRADPILRVAGSGEKGSVR